MPTATPVLSFDAAAKRKFVARAKSHQLADEIVKGTYWRDGKGCAVGCLVHGSSHERLASELGIPVQMAYLIDRLFEGMPLEQSKMFPLRFVKAEAMKFMDMPIATLLEMAHMNAAKLVSVEIAQ